MNPLETKQTYQDYVNKKSPNSPIFKNCFNAFWVGGLICTIGQIISNICKERGFDVATSGTIVSIILIGIAAFLTGLNLFNKNVYCCWTCISFWNISFYSCRNCLLNFQYSNYDISVIT